MLFDTPETYRALAISPSLAAIAFIPATYLLYKALRKPVARAVYMSLALYFFTVTPIVSYVITIPDAIRP